MYVIIEYKKLHSKIEILPDAFQYSMEKNNERFVPFQVPLTGQRTTSQTLPELASW
jgi:hypothetical protein